ncbi:thioesterase family protein [Nocardioides sp. R-C-SC26]|uniref:acyl-CoA thioesterase n=1 Tax=Nocardioides sp. R-C-SC26 TaxID=2870414 RepID=UPI001E64A718|nr:thioesterase family protein [Nocardioides sp. R-C-SC26]
MRHVYDCPTRWADLDQLGHVNNVIYVDYLQEARIDLMRHLFGPRPIGAADLVEGVVVVRQEISYLAPLGFGFGPVSVECWVSEVKAATFTISYEIFHAAPDRGSDGRRVYARARSVLAPFVFAEERPRRLDVEERRVLRDVLESPGDGGAGWGELVAVEVDDVVVSREAQDALRYDVHVRFSDVDAYRHVNNVVYFEYFQESRIRLLAQVARDAGVVGNVVVAAADVGYLAPMLQRSEPYLCRSSIVAVGSRSVTVAGEIVDPADQARVYARARVTLVFFDPATQRSAEPPAALRETLMALLAPA